MASSVDYEAFVNDTDKMNSRIKAIASCYNRDIEEVAQLGEKAFRAGRDFFNDIASIIVECEKLPIAIEEKGECGKSSHVETQLSGILPNEVNSEPSVTHDNVNFAEMIVVGLSEDRSDPNDCAARGCAEKRKVNLPDLGTKTVYDGVIRSSSEYNGAISNVLHTPTTYVCSFRKENRKYKNTDHSPSLKSNISRSDFYVDEDELDSGRKKSSPKSGNFDSKSLMDGRCAEDKELEDLQFLLKALQNENHLLEQQILCIQCKSAERDSLFMPCGHFILCTHCSEQCAICPLCGVQILATSKTRLS